MRERAIRRAAAWTLTLTLLTACGGHGSGSVTPAGGALPPARPVQGNGFAYDATSIASAQFVGPAQVKTISIDAIPRLQNASGLLAYARQVSDPHSGAYRHFLTPTEIGDRFGASASDYTAAVKYFTSNGIAVATWPQRLLLHVSGSQAAMESAFGTKFGWYKNQRGTFLAPMTAPVMPATLPVGGSPDIVQTVARDSDLYQIKSPHGQNDGLLYGYSPQQIAAAFDYTGAYRAGFTGAGITVGVIGTGGFDDADVTAFKTLYHINGSGTAQLVSATDANAPGNGATGFATPPPVTAPCMGMPYMPRPGCNPEDGEAQLDTEQIAALAYDSTLDFYLAYNPNDGCGAVGTACPPGTGVALQGLAEIDAELQTAIAQNQSDILSLSFGGPEPAEAGYTFNASGYGFEPLEFAALASEGIAVFVSSGDAGAEQCQQPYYQPEADSVCVSYPATDPNVVAVGGTNTPLNSAGQFVGPLTGWGAQTTGGFGGSGGGVSAYFPLTAYEQNAAGITGSMRNVPDVALEGDANTGVAMLMYGDPSLGTPPVYEAVGGTSVAAPEAAAMWALVLQACKQQASCSTAGGSHSYRLGNPNAYFYKIYGNATQYASTFYDVLYGFNGQQNSCWVYGPTPPPDPSATPGPCPTMDAGYQAAKGYDLISGIGVPFARALIKAVVGV